jgi:hypothetical protein
MDSVGVHGPGGAGCGKTQKTVIPRRAFCRGISHSFDFKTQRDSSARSVPRNDNVFSFFAGGSRAAKNRMIFSICLSGGVKNPA